MNPKKVFLFSVIACCALAMPAAFGRDRGGDRSHTSSPHRSGHHWRGGDNGRWSGHHGRWHHRRHPHSSWNVYLGFGYPYYFGYPYPYYAYNYPYDYYEPYYPSYYAASAPIYQGRTVAPRGDRSLVVQVQQELARARYYNGPIDGIIGSGTRRAIRGYERAHGLPVDGRIDPALLALMGLA